MRLKTHKIPAALTTLWTPLAKQALALSCPVDDILFGGAVGGGKTDFLLAAWVQHAHLYAAGANGLIVRKTLPELRDIMRRAHRLFPQLGATWKGSDRTWTFPNGAILLFGYLETEEDAARYWGQEYTFLGIDEAGHYKTSAPLDMLRSRLRSTVPGMRLQVILTANPGGKGHKWLVERYINPSPPYVPFIARNEDGDDLGFMRVYIPSRLADNPYLMKDRSYVGRILSSGPKWLVKALLMGDWRIQMDAGVLKREWWQDYSMLPAGDPLHIIQSWDTSFGKTTSKNGDASVCTTWAVYSGGYYLLDVWSGRVDFPALKKVAIDLAAKWACYEILIEDMASGQSLIQELMRESRLAIRPVKPDADKTTRAFAVSPLIESKRVFIPAANYVSGDSRFPIVSTWRADFLDETSAFPNAAHDDIVDSVSQALRNLATRFVVGNAADHTYSLADIYDDDN